MLHTNTITPRLLDVLDKIKHLEELRNFRLVGGTSLALQLGHRESADIDMFSDKSFNHQELEYILGKIFPQMQIISRSINGFSSLLNEVRCDFYDWRNKFIRPPVDFNGINLAAIEDITAFKLDAVSHRTEVKDFWDIAELLEKYSLKEMLGFYREKYPFQDIRIVLDSLPKVHRIQGNISYKIFREHSLDFVKQKIQNSLDVFFKEQIENKKKLYDERIKNAERLIAKKKKL
ncbi:MAG: nucleotidyl transferase AbiEii/AbiGii toxin family protein [Bacteroidia bacterium]|nr:nucleotidyl transferase AbiEii/AbiGii toxin family protein [Bacteroidia bacterium]